MANTLTLSLPEYINVHKDELLTKSVAGAKTLDYIYIMPNVKHKDAIPYIDSTVVLQGASCGWNPQGADTIGERYIEVKTVEVEKEFCWLDFKEKFANYQLLFEAGREKLPFEQKIAESNMNAVQDAVEELIWGGDSTLGITGLVEAIATEHYGDRVEFQSGDAMASRVDAMVAAIPAHMLKKGVNLFIGYADFRKYVAELNSGCCANRPIIDAASDTIVYSGDSRVKIIPVMGLEGKNFMAAATEDALVYGTDLKGSESVYKMWFDEKEDKFLFKVLFNAGVAVARPDEVVYGAE